MQWTARVWETSDRLFRGIVMNRLIYIIGFVVVVVAVLAFFGFR